ncbi:MAG: hypothetical protein HY892_09410 [Deltaproteobacteria bacterium]|nr:hypothetical protein [Deltaproteobacteria bacterium]
MKLFVRLLIVLIGLTVLCGSGPAVAQDMECTVITKIVGRQVTLAPENKNLKPFVIETEDVAGLKVGDQVWVQDGKIVSCALKRKEGIEKNK